MNFKSAGAKRANPQTAAVSAQAALREKQDQRIAELKALNYPALRRWFKEFSPRS